MLDKKEHQILLWWDATKEGGCFEALFRKVYKMIRWTL